MKSSACASDEIKSASLNLPQGRLHRVAISSTKWIYSDEGGFSSKKPHLIQMRFFWWNMVHESRTLNEITCGDEILALLG